MHAAALLVIGLFSQLELRMATLAPPGSAWAKAMDRGARQLAEATGGRVRLRWYFGGVQGDERDVVRKMKLGQLDGAALSAVGLGLVRSDVRVLELPFLFRSYEEIDTVRARLEGEFERGFAEAGYILLSWGDLGWVHMFSSLPLTSTGDVLRAHHWAHADDPIGRAVFKRLGINGVPLGIAEVLTALQTGQVSIVYGPPLAAIALQWHTKLRFAVARPSAYAIGALILRKEIWEQIAPADRELMRAGSRVLRDELTAIVRRDNERAKEAMKKAGIVFIDVPEERTRLYDDTARLVWDDLAGSLYPKELLERVKAVLAEVRKQP